MTVKLRARDEAFCQAVFSGANLSEALKATRDTSRMLPATIHESASRLAHKYSTRIDELREATSTAIVKARAWDATRFIDEAEQNMGQARELGQMAPANGALALIGKVTGIVAESTSSPDTALDAIIKLAALMSDAQLRAQAAMPAIEGSFEVIPSE